MPTFEPAFTAVNTVSELISMAFKNNSFPLHCVWQVTEFYITTHGFLSLSPRLHDYIYKTQYIAPLRSDRLQLAHPVPGMVALV